MKRISMILCVCILALLVSVTVIGCGKDEESSVTTQEYRNPPSYGTDDAPEEDDVIIEGDGEEGGDIKRPSITAQQ